MLLRKAHVFMEEHPMPVVYLLLIAVVCSTVIPASVSAQTPKGTPPPRLTVPDAQTVEPRNDEEDDATVEASADVRVPDASADNKADADSGSQPNTLLDDDVSDTD